MRPNTHSTRAFIAFLVTWSFVVLTLTGVVLYVVPHGRVSNWIFWSLAGLDKNAWSDIHILFGAVFIVSGALHLYFNWKPFTRYLAERVRGHLTLKRELITSLSATLLLILGALFAVPPVSWLFELNDWAKSAWSRAPSQEPPYPRAEASPLPMLAQRLGFDLDVALQALNAAGISPIEPGATLESLARAHDTTPAALFALIPTPTPSVTADPAAIEARLVGSGLGAKTLAAFATEQGLTPETAIARLANIGLVARPEDTLKQIAERHATRPMEIAKSILVSDAPPPTRP